MDSFVLLAYANLAASRTLLQQFLACLNFTLDSEDLSFCYKWKKRFIWTMVAAQATENHGNEWGLIWYWFNSKLNPLSKFTSSSRSTEFKDILPRNISQMITKTVPISKWIVISYETNESNEIGHLIGNMIESQWKLRQQHDHFPMEGKNKYYRQKKKNNPKEQDCENHNQWSE